MDGDGNAVDADGDDDDDKSARLFLYLKVLLSAELLREAANFVAPSNECL